MKPLLANVEDKLNETKTDYLQLSTCGMPVNIWI